MKLFIFEPFYEFGKIVIKVWDNDCEGAVRRAQKRILKFFYPDMGVREAYEHLDYVFEDFCPTAMAIQEAARNMYHHPNLVGEKDSKAKRKNVVWKYTEC